MKAKEIRELTDEQLSTKLEEARAELFNHEPARQHRSGDHRQA